MRVPSLIQELLPSQQIRHHCAPGADGVVRVGHGLHEVLAAVVILLLVEALLPRRVAHAPSSALSARSFLLAWRHELLGSHHV